MEPLYEKREKFQSTRGIDATFEALEETLKSARIRFTTEKNRIIATKGSNVKLRFWGTMLKIGRDAIPAGLTVEVTPTAEGTALEVYAYDRLGWFFDRETSEVLRERSNENIDELIALVKTSLSDYTSRET